MFRTLVNNNRYTLGYVAPASELSVSTFQCSLPRWIYTLVTYIYTCTGVAIMKKFMYPKLYMIEALRNYSRLYCQKTDIDMALKVNFRTI